MDTKKGTGFAAPIIGTVYPEGTKFKKNANGKYTAILPKEKSKEKKETKKKK